MKTVVKEVQYLTLQGEHISISIFRGDGLRHRYMRLSDLPEQDQKDFYNFLFGRQAPLPDGEEPGDCVWYQDFREYIAGQKGKKIIDYKKLTYNGKLSSVTIYRQTPPAKKLAELKSDYPHILNVGPYLFFLTAFEAQPGKRRFSLLSKFQSSYLTGIDREKGNVAALRKWWQVFGRGKDDGILKNLPDLDLAGDDGWEVVDQDENGWLLSAKEW